MIVVKAPISRVRPGDLVRMTGAKAPARVVTIDLDEGSVYHSWVTVLEGHDKPWHSSPWYEVEVLFSSDREIAERILEVLAPFDPETLQAVRRGLCAECGRVACGRHS